MRKNFWKAEIGHHTQESDYMKEEERPSEHLQAKKRGLKRNRPSQKKKRIEKGLCQWKHCQLGLKWTERE